MKFPYALGLIGANGVGIAHRQAIDLLQKQGRAFLKAVADPTLKKHPELRDELLSKNVNVYPDYETMLNAEPDLSAVTIATPTPFHAEMTRRCLKQGVKVYLEKPPVPLIQQLDELIAMDVLGSVYVGFQMINSAWATQLKQWIVEGRFGEIKTIRAGACWPRTDSYYNRAFWAGKMTSQNTPIFDGPATNALAHLIQSIMFLADSSESGYAEPIAVQGELYRARRIESYDTACARGWFRSGIVFEIAVTHATQNEWPFHIHINGSNGWATVSGDGRLLESSWRRKLDDENTVELMKRSYELFLDYIEGHRTKVITSLNDTRGYVLTTNGMLLSSNGIRDIENQWIRSYRNTQNDSGYDVTSLRDAIQETVQTGKLFSEQSLPWSQNSSVINLDDITQLCIK
jgi:predicted dehydrogenase